MAMTLYYVANARIPTQKAHGRTIAQFCAAAGEQGHDVTLVVPKRKNNISEDVFSFYGVSESFSVKFLTTIDLFWAEKWIGRLAFMIQSLSFIVSLKLWLFFKSRKNTVVYTREPWALAFGLWGFTTVFEAHVLPRRFTALFGWLVRRAKLVVAISQSLGKRLLALGASHVTVEPSPVAYELFAQQHAPEKVREELEIPQDKFVVMYTGSFTTMNQDKGLKVMIEALAKLPEDIHMVAVGASERDHAVYSDVAKQHGVVDRIALHSFQPHETVAKFHQAADVLAMPFPMTEHYNTHMSPIKMVEYMASQRPIVASRLNTITEVLTDDHAWLCEPDSVESFVEQVLAVQKVREEKVQEKIAKSFAAAKRYAVAERTGRILDLISDTM